MLDTIQEIDKNMFISVNHGLSTPFMDSVMTFISGPWPWVLVLLVWVAQLVARKDKEGARTLFMCLLIVGICDATSSYLLKPFFGRARPCKIYDFVRIVEGCAGYMSFPSNHATNAMAVATVCLRFCGRLAGFAMLFLAVVIAFSRVYMGVHYPFDVTAGVLFGFGFSSFWIWVLMRFGWLKGR